MESKFEKELLIIYLKNKVMNPAVQNFIQKLETESDQKIGEKLTELIDDNLNFTENKIWHAIPVWFIEGNPIVGFSKQKAGIRLMFWSGADFEEPQLTIRGGKFKDASIFYNSPEEIVENDIIRWINKSESIQWDYKNLVKRKGELLRLK
jgi:hypothetical protein